MSDSFPQHSGEPLSDDQFLTSWARISLDFGHSGIEVAHDTEPVADDPTERLRREIEQMIGAIRQSAKGDSSSTDPVVQRLEGMNVTPELLEEMLSAEAEADSIPDSERAADEPEEPRGLRPRANNDMVVVDLTIPPTTPDAEDNAENDSAENGDTLEPSEDFDPEFDRRVSEASSEDVVQALVLASVDLPEVMVYEADEDHVDVFVLCLQLDDEAMVTAHLGEDGKLTKGSDFEEFAENLLEHLPARGGLCATEDSYSVQAPVTVLGEELRLDADSLVAALIELEAPEVPTLVADTFVASPVSAVPADNGWTMISTDPVSMLNLLRSLAKPAIVAESNGTNHHLSFVVPGGHGRASGFEKGTWGEWMNRVVGDPVPDDTDSGAVIDLHWGAPKTLTRYVPQNSFALDTLWTLPGNLPEPLNFVRTNDEVENLSWIYGLDETATKRLRNYVEDSASELGMESVLQLLDLPDELSKIVLGQFDIETLAGHKIYFPDMGVGEVVKESLTAYPNGDDRLSSVSRQLMDRPWIFAVDGAVQLSASALLAGMAARRRARGQSARTAALGALALFGTGLAEFAVSRSYQKMKDLNADGKTRLGKGQKELSLMEELQNSAEETSHPVQEPGVSLQQMREKAESFAKKVRKRFKK
ncbi:hypothetical protein [Rothia aerolata]|uniref:Uncharacterized protein n=1 Tax=Rothia aerolata TaxID=1812262 RepID=A0A917MQY0_9MICC|nr:hypothetical protein [Rothia aerolata]GGH58644.1 hypothetical protein GCM10007359_05070 [Rothia aerolata]